MNGEICLSEKQKDCFCIAAIIGLLFVRFFRTLFLSQPISKLFLVAHWDSIFYPLRAGHSLSMDPSVVQQFLPFRFFVSDYWHHGIPLWNQYSGFGMPLLADPQSCALSPLDVFMIIFNSIHTWDVVLILELAIGAIFTYLLSRQLELNVLAALTAALLFAFCPWLQWQLELLGRGICLVPFVFFFFVRLGKSNSISRAVPAGIAAATDIVSSHPEIAFITVISATVLTFLISYYKDSSKFRFASNFYKICVAGLIAFGLSAPMLIPFAEYVINGESYKMGIVASAGLPLQALIANYLFPFYAKGSLFFGPLSWWGVMAALVFLGRSGRFAILLIVCLSASVIAVTRFVPFELLFTLPLLSMTYATYCLPEYLLFISIVSGLGISILIDNACAIKEETTDGKRRKLKIALVCLGVVILTVVPLLFSPWHHSNINLQFDVTFEPPRFNGRQWLFNTSFASVMLLILITIMSKPLRMFSNLRTTSFSKLLSSLSSNLPYGSKSIWAGLFVGLGILNLILVSLESLPTRPYFSYPSKLPTKVDNDDRSRIISVGNHLLKPNTNVVYKLPMVQVLNPLYPNGFLEFVKACGGQADQYTQVFPPVISRLLGAAGVGTILSPQPILDEAALPKQQHPLGQINKVTNHKDECLQPISYDQAFNLEKMQLLYDAKSRALFFRTQVVPLSDHMGNYHLCLSIEDMNGKSVSYIAPEPISALSVNEEACCSGFVPKNLQLWQVSLRVFRDKDCSFVGAASVPFGKVRNDDSWLLFIHPLPKRHVQSLSAPLVQSPLVQSSPAPPVQSSFASARLFTEIDNSRFKLLSDNNGVLVYKDRMSLDRCFFVNKIKWVEQRGQALSYMKEHSNQLKNIAVMESAQRKSLEAILAQLARSPQSPRPPQMHLNKSDWNSVPNNSTTFSLFPKFVLQVDAAKTSLLVISDLYYPGWKVYLDNTPWQMLRADYLFRAVPIPPGKHLVRFEYQPDSFKIGIILWAITVFSLVLWFLFWFKNKFATDLSLKRRQAQSNIQDHRVHVHIGK